LYPVLNKSYLATDLKKETKYKIFFEVLWILITILITFLVMYPIESATQTFPFKWVNIWAVIAFITLARYIFLLKHTFLAYNFPLKLILFFAMIPLCFYFIGGLADFQIYKDDIGFESFLSHLDRERQGTIIKYLSTEFIFFGTAAIITAIIFSFRMMKSIWSVRNRGIV